MLKPMMVPLALMVATPVPAQQSQPPIAQPEAKLVGLPVYSSDGEKLGEVTSAVKAAGKSGVRVEMGTFLGLSPSQVLIDGDVFQNKGERLELNMTAAQVRERISQQNQKKE